MKIPRIALAAIVFAFITQQSALAITDSSQPPSTAPTETGTAAAAAAANHAPVRDKWALIIGIGTFQSDKIPKLQYSDNDAQSFYNYLIKEGNFAPDHVRILLDKDATQRRIMSELGSKFLARLAKPDDLIVLFFSTHGSPSQMDVRGENYLVAYDSDPEDLFATGIEMQKILESIKGRVLSDRVVLVMDACHSGSVDPNAKGMFRVGNFDANTMAEGSGQLVICSSKPDEQSWESKRYQNSVFTKNLLDGLRSNGKTTSLSQAFDKTRELVTDEVQEDRPGARQTPVMSSKWQGSDLIMAVKPTSPEAIPDSVVRDLEPDSFHNQSGSKGMALPAQPEPAKPGTLILTQSYFGNDANPNKAYSEACSQKDAHFNDPSYYFRVAKILIEMKNYSKAEQELKGLIVDDPNNSDYYLARAYCYHKMKKETAASDELSRAKFKNPTLPDKILFGD